jgi:sortase (surface protein transpeptidase)
VVRTAVQNHKVFEQPARLRIPKIGVDAAIDQMSLTKDGALQAPDGAKNVGWYKLGPHPGNKGVAVIDGHYGTWKNGATSVFDNLNKLLPGDHIEVQDTAGATASFVVRDYKRYPLDKPVPELFTASDNGVHLNLITCQGFWNEARQTYTDRLIVFADLAVPANKH